MNESARIDIKSDSYGVTARLKKAMNRLAELAPNGSPLLSCFVDLTEPRHHSAARLELQVKELAHPCNIHEKKALMEAFFVMKDHLLNEVSDQASGAAIYVRSGPAPFFEALEFGVTFDTKLIVSDLPQIYPLVETRDSYERFVVVVVREESARILETTMGSITREIFQEKPALRERLGREWTREHYQSHKRDRDERFVRMKVEIVEELMRRRGHNHLVVSGSPKMVSRFTNALPKRLQELVISTLTAPSNKGVGFVVDEAVALSVAKENLDSQKRVQTLKAQLMSGGLAVAGEDSCRRALIQGYADMLVIDHDYRDPSIREELVRLAIKNGITVETVKNSDDLKFLGEVGCLLRYRPSGINHSNDESLLVS
jgi:hypothetical protein